MKQSQLLQIKNCLGLIFFFSLSVMTSAQDTAVYKWENGNIKAKGFLEMGGIENGRWEFFSKEGVLQQVVTYDFGEFDGPFENYYENGKLKEEGYFMRAMRDSAFKAYYPNEQLEVEGYFKRGFRDSLWVFYYENGNKKESGEFEMDQRLGEWKSWYENGQLKEVREITEGQEKVQSYYSKDGKQLVKNGKKNFLKVLN